MNNGAIECSGKPIVSLDDYFNWLKKEIEGTTVVIGKRFDILEVIPEEILKGNKQEVVCTDEEVEKVLQENKEVTILGGERVFEASIDKVDKIKLAEIDGVEYGDTYFPYFNVDNFGVKYLGEVEGKHHTGVIKEYYRKSKKD